MVDGILEQLASRDNRVEGDYVGSDGMLYCGSCNERKQSEKQWPDGSTRKVPLMCKCQVDAHEARLEHERKEERAHQLRRARVSSMMDTNFKTAVFENFRKNKANEKQFETAARYCKEFRAMYEQNQGLLFYGSPGTGKSYTAACIANYLLCNNLSVVMTSFVRILQELKGGFDRDSREREETFVNALSAVRLLIIDDLGAERNTDYALEKVYAVIDGRYRAKKPMILTTNLSLAQMQAVNDIRYERIYDRIFEMCYPVEFTGVSWRKREAAERFEQTKKILEG